MNPVVKLWYILLMFILRLSRFFSRFFEYFFFMFLNRGIKSFQEEFFDNTNEEIVGMFDFLDWNEDKGNPENLNGDVNKTYTQGNYLQISYRTLSIIRRGLYIVYPHFYCSFICRAVRRDWSPKFETELNIIIGIVQKV